MNNCWEATVAIYAILKAGAVFSPINASTKADKLAYIIENCRARAIIAQEKLAPVAVEAMGDRTSCDLIVATKNETLATPYARSFDSLLQVEPMPVPHGGIDVDHDAAGVSATRALAMASTPPRIGSHTGTLSSFSTRAE